MKAHLKTSTRVAAGALLLAALPFAVSDAASVDRAAAGAKMTFSKYYPKGPASSCESGGQDVVCSQMIVTPLRFTVPASAAGRATVTVALQYRTTGQGRFTVSAGTDIKDVILPRRRPIAPSKVPTSATFQFEVKGLVPGQAREIAVVTNTGLKDEGIANAAGITTSRMLVTVELRD